MRYSIFLILLALSVSQSSIASAQGTPPNVLFLDGPSLTKPAVKRATDAGNSTQAAIPDNWKLVISQDGRRIEKADGSDWFWLGDTAWALFVRLNREQVDRYLEKRASQGFTVIQSVAVMGYSFPWNGANAYGQRPFHDGQVNKPNEKFWKHADYIVNKARSHGMYVALLPAWGSFWGKQATVEYAEWIANRYQNQENVIWVNGGDRPVGKDAEMFNEIGRVFHDSCSDHLTTFHPNDSSSKHFHHQAWLDFNMHQSSHGHRDNRADKLIDDDWTKSPPKPTLDGEPCYEGHPIGWKWGAGEFQSYDVRQLAYWTVFAGAPGITYGHVCVWIFNDSKNFYYKHPHNSISPNIDWRDAIDSDGANNMTQLINLMMSRPHRGRNPAQHILRDELGGAMRLRATLGKGYAFVYTARGDNLNVDLNKLPWNKSNAWWFNPRDGKAKRIAKVSDSGSQTFDPPGGTGRDKDWVLVIDDADKGYGMPGTRLVVRADGE